MSTRDMFGYATGLDSRLVLLSRGGVTTGERSDIHVFAFVRMVLKGGGCLSTVHRSAQE